MKFQATIKNGVVRTETPDKLKRFLATLEGVKVVLDIEKYKKARTLSQNAYVHVLFKYISDYTGHSFERIKVLEKKRHLKPKEVILYGKVNLVLPSTRELEKQEMADFIENVLADCAFLEIKVPTKEELGYISNT